MLAIVAFIYFLCWFPFYTLMIGQLFYDIGNKLQYKTLLGFNFFAYFLSMARSMVNPIIYSIMSRNFRVRKVSF